jgi:hypothetical protein
MKIDASQVTLAASHSASSRRTVQETLHAWVGNTRPNFEATENRAPSGTPSWVTSISMAAQNAAAQAAATAGSTESGEAQAIKDASDSASHDPMLNLIKSVVEMLTGHKIKLMSADDLQSGQQSSITPVASQSTAAPPQRAGFGVEYDRHEVIEENEQTAVHAQGSVHTSDGKEISFDLDVAMTRSYREEVNESVRAGDGIKKDPLVINFGGTAAQLQSKRFQFDLDGDGKAENVPMLAGGSGYLALDMNGNGKVDSGKELFGALSGNGFAELARYDGDQNGWIDGNDAVFDKIKVWTPDGNGGGALGSLKQNGVGALYLGNVASPFELKDGANRELGAVRASSIYLSENGSAGTLQQIDLTV